MELLKANKRDNEGFWLIPCPKIEYAEVPIYNCAGSFVKGKWICDFVQSASMGLDSAEVECLWPNPRDSSSSQKSEVSQPTKKAKQRAVSELNIPELEENLRRKSEDTTT